MGLVKKTMADRGSTVVFAGYILPSSSAGSPHFHDRSGLGRKGHCHFCKIFGEVVDKFPRRGYGPKDYSP
jgi:hypothetical protein